MEGRFVRKMKRRKIKGREILKEFLYLFYNPLTKQVKIGITNNPKRRQGQVERIGGMPIEPLFLCSSNLYSTIKELEDKLHLKYEDERMIGEWFLLSESQIRDLEKEVSHTEGIEIEFKVKEKYKYMPSEIVKEPSVEEMKSAVDSVFDFDLSKIPVR